MTESNVSEILALSRQLRPPQFVESDIQDLFLQLTETYTKYEGNAFERLQTLLGIYQRDGKLEQIKDAIDIIKPGLLPPRNKKP